MPSQTRPARLESATPQNGVLLLLVDQQESLFSRIHQAEQTRRNLLALARSARLLGVPAVLTTALAAGPNGPQLQELTQTFAGQPVIDRTLISAWRDSRVREAITRTERTKVIIAGTGLDVCAGPLPGAQQRVLEGVFGILEPAGHVATVGVQFAAVRLGQPATRILSAPAGSLPGVSPCRR